jgi:hypothetical protein
MASTRKGKSKDLSTSWSRWEWDEQGKTWYQSRYNSDGDEEWRYPDTTDLQAIPRSLDDHCAYTTGNYSNTGQSSSPIYGTNQDSSYTTGPASIVDEGPRYGNYPLQNRVVDAPSTYDAHYASPPATGALEHSSLGHPTSRPNSSGSMADSVATLRPSMSSDTNTAQYAPASAYNDQSYTGSLTTSFQTLGISSASTVPTTCKLLGPSD